MKIVMKFDIDILEHDGYCSDEECEYENVVRYIVCDTNVKAIPEDGFLPLNTFSSVKLIELVNKSGFFERNKRYKKQNCSFYTMEEGFIVRDTNKIPYDSGVCGRGNVPSELRDLNCNCEYWDLMEIRVKN
jgi:hypothetical protein